ncbi:MAG: glycosyltransferase family 4 protein [Myxococcales bacterium]|nr:glycosyltransferase family 4 protein [Myxococcales bacterium]
MKQVFWPMVALDRSGLWTYGVSLARAMGSILHEGLHLGSLRTQRDALASLGTNYAETNDGTGWMDWLSKNDRRDALVHFPVGNRRLFPMRKARQVATVHDIAEYRFPERFGPLHTFHVKWVLAPLLRQMHAVIAVSEQTRQDLLEFVGLEPSRVRTIHNGVDTQRFRPATREQEKEVQRRHHLSDSYWLYVSRLEHPVKNHVTLLEAYAALRSMGKDLPQLVFIGAPDIRADVVMERIASLKLERAVRCLGYVEAAELPVLISGAKASLFPSLYEGFGLPVLESMSCGTPVICSDIKVFDEFVPSDALRFPARDVDALAHCLLVDLERARERVTLSRDLTWEACARRTFAVYQDVMEG